jgi:hypothetical protein
MARRSLSKPTIRPGCERVYATNERGCHLNRKIDDLLAEAGFRLDRLETG